MRLGRRLSIYLTVMSALGSIIFVLINRRMQTRNPPVPVSRVDLTRYAGLWYEIAKIPNRFQRRCARDTTARYSMREDGRITVVNRCLDSQGNLIEAQGVARAVDESSNAKLKVRFLQLFGIPLFEGDYWVIGLGEDYSYAIVGHPTRKYGWILARTPELSPEELDEISTILTRQRYNPEAFRMTTHSRPAVRTQPLPRVF